MEAFMTILVVAVPIFEILGILAAMHAVMNARTSQGAVAWAVALVTLPFVTLFLYAIFGRNKFHGYVRMRSQQDAAIHHFRDDFASEARAKQLSRPPKAEADRALVQLADMPPVGFNQSELLIDGEATFARIFEAIAAARSYILVQFYIIKDDGLGRELKDRLVRQPRPGLGAPVDP